ncbi:MAG: hypothetical protein EOP45_11280, partial [Sphingobacteriaceae bacterium]
MLLNSLCKFSWIFIYFGISNDVVDAYQDVLLQCKLLLNGLEILHPEIQRLIRSTSKGYKKRDLAQSNLPVSWILERRKDPFSHLRMLIQQGALLCELSKSDSIFRCQDQEKILLIKEQYCFYPTFDSSVTEQDRMHQQTRNLQQFIENSGQYYNLPTLEELQMPTTSVTLDIMEILEEWINKLSLLIPIYPVIQGYDSSGSDQSSSDYSPNQSSEILPILQTLNKHAIAELETTEEKYIQTLVKMNEYEIECKSLLDQADKADTSYSYVNALDQKLILQKRMLWFPQINRLREFHVQFYVNILNFHSGLRHRKNSVTENRLSIERFVSFFVSFHDALPIYNQWIDSSVLVGAEIIEQEERFPIAFPVLNDLIPLDKSIGGMASLRIQPMQRLLRYPLLLKELLRNIENEQTRFSLETAHLIMTAIATRVNENREKQL